MSSSGDLEIKDDPPEKIAKPGPSTSGVSGNSQKSEFFKQKSTDLARPGPSTSGISGNSQKSEFFKQMSIDLAKPGPSTSGVSGISQKSEFFKQKSTDFAKPGPSRSTISGALLVHPKQRGNPILKYISSVPWEFSEIVPDYVMGRTNCALFLSLRYHQLNPDYIHTRIKALGKAYALRVLLVQVDVPEPNYSLKNLNRICLLADLTLMLAWSAEEAGKMLETYKAYENKPPDMIMEKSETAPYHKVASALTTVRSVNKTDAVTLLANFGSLEKIIAAPEARLALLPGFGKQKAQRLYKTLHEPFLKNSAPKD